MKTFKFPEKPTERTRLRVIETQFYLVIQALTGKDLERDTIYMENIIENICLLYGIKTSDVTFAINNLFSSQGKPSKLEYILTGIYGRIPVRDVCRLAKMSQKTYYEILEHYVVYEGGYDLIPRLEENTILELEKFIQACNTIFSELAMITKR